VSNFKWGLIGGLLAFVLSFALGLVNGAVFFYIIIRALVFGAVFFGLGSGIYILINSYFPELLFSESPGGASPAANLFGPEPGSRVNISVGDTSGAALPGTEGQDDVGSLSDLISGSIDPAAQTRAARESASGQGLDQNTEHGYTYEGGAAANGGNRHNAGLAGGGDSGGFQGDFDEAAPGSDALGGLPDLDAMAGSFLSGAEDVFSAAPPPAESYQTSVPERKPSGNKAREFEGDFNPREIAAGIRTVLSKDK
jgi:hypothetical protein